MSHLYNVAAGKKATNVSINRDLLMQAKKFKINISKTLEHSLEQILREKQKELWQAENQKAIDEYNERIKNHGLFSDGLREF